MLCCVIAFVGLGSAGQSANKEATIVLLPGYKRSYLASGDQINLSTGDQINLSTGDQINLSTAQSASTQGLLGSI